jgi:hypothetical protein
MKKLLACLSVAMLAMALDAIPGYAQAPVDPDAQLQSSLARLTGPTTSDK